MKLNPTALGSTIGATTVLAIQGGTTARDWVMCLVAWAAQVVVFSVWMPEPEEPTDA